MAHLSRRGFLASSVAATAGVAGLGLAAGVPAAMEALDGPLASGDVIAHVSDASTGEITVFNGERETVVRDRALASRLRRAAG